MKTLITLILAALAFSAPAAQIACPSVIKPGMSYHLARGKLIDAGFLPVKWSSQYHVLNSDYLHLGYVEASDTIALRTKPYSHPIFEWTGKHGDFSITTKAPYDDSITLTVIECSAH